MRSAWLLQWALTVCFLVALPAQAQERTSTGAVPPGRGPSNKAQADSRLIPPLPVRTPAPDFDGAKGWLNTTKPLSIKDLRGKIVLLDFWTFCCINCMHELPNLAAMEKSFQKELVVVGVHSGKFSHEKDLSPIREAVLRYGIKHPVVNDPDFKIWKAYGARGWPTFVLVDPEGNIYNRVAGEGYALRLMHTINELQHEYMYNGLIKRTVPSFVKPIAPEDSVLLFPGKLLVDSPSKRLFISDSGHNRVLVCDLSGNVLATVGSGASGSEDGHFSKATFNNPQGLALRGEELYVADTDNHLIRLVDLKGKTVRTIAGTGVKGTRRGGPARMIALNSPWDLCFGPDGKLYIAMAGTHQIWRFDLQQGMVGPFAGSGIETIKDGKLLAASLAQPSGISCSGNKLYFADSETSSIRSCDLVAPGSVNTLVGKGLFSFGDATGTFQETKLQHPLSVVAGSGKLYVADTYNNKVKMLDLATKKSRTISGAATGGGRSIKTVELAEPSGLSLAGQDLWIADTNNHAVRVLNLKTGAIRTVPIAPAAKAKGEGQGGPTTGAKTGATHSGTPETGQSTADLKTIPADKKVDAGKLSVPPGKSSTLQVDFALPKGFHLNPLAPLRYAMVKNSGDGIQVVEKYRTGVLSPPRAPLVIPIRTGPPGSSSRMETVFEVFYCSSGSNAICKRKVISISADLVCKEGSRAPALTCLVE